VRALGVDDFTVLKLAIGASPSQVGRLSQVDAHCIFVPVSDAVCSGRPSTLDPGSLVILAPL